jgi:hypothetical protein
MARLAGRSYPFIAQRYTFPVHDHESGEIVYEYENENDYASPKQTAHCPLITGTACREIVPVHSAAVHVSRTRP